MLLSPRIALLVLLFVAPAGAGAFAQAALVDDVLTGYSLTSWNDGEGHRLGSVYAIVQDDRGYLWIGSDAGLFRFDGSRFTSWATMSATPLPAVAVRALHVTRDGSIWVGLADGAGVRQLRGETIAPPFEGLSATDAVSDLVEDHQGTMWAVSGRVLYRLRDGRWSKVTLPWREREGLVLQPLVGRNGDLWVGTRWGVFHRPAGGGFEVASREYVWGLSEDAAGRIWTTDIVSGFRPLAAPSSEPHGLEGAGYRLIHDRRGNLWIATFGEGLWRVAHDTRQGPARVERANLRTGLSSDSVQALAEDRDGNIWVGTTGGLHRLTERKLTPVQDVGFVVAIEQDADGRVWAGTTNGVIRFAASPTAWNRAGGSGQGLDIRSLYRHADGTLWVGSTDGLYRLRGNRLERVAIAGRPQMLVMSISPDGRGGLWLGDGDWLYRWQGGRLVPLAAPPGAEESLRITFARHDSRGRVWLGFSNGRLGELDEDGRLQLVATGDDALPHRAIFAAIDDADDVVWIGGSGGLTRLAHGRAATISRTRGLPGDRIWSIVQDAQRQLWLSMDRGLVRLDPDEVVRALDDPSYRLQYALYDTHDGLAGAAIGVIHSVRATDGSLWFVRGGGVTVVDPAALADETAAGPAPIHIESVVANEQRVGPDARTAFAAGTRRIQISYTALALTASGQARFRYRLEGFDTDWVDAGPRRTAYYTNLSPGQYRFRVAADAEDEAHSSEATWDFSIRPAFYQTPAFAALAGAAVCLGIWGAWRARLNLARRQFTLALAERARLSREIHDTLLQSLVGVALQLDAVSNSLGPASVNARAQLTRIRRLVESYIREARQSIWDLRSPLLDARDMASALHAFGKRAVADTPVRFAMTVNGTPYRCTPKVENQLLRIGQEALTNSVRHAEATRVHLELTFAPAAVTLRVSDNGRGFEIAHSAVDPEHHYGLTTMRERAEELDGQFSLISAAGRGTRVEAVIPTSPVASREATAEA